MEIRESEGSSFARLIRNRDDVVHRRDTPFVHRDLKSANVLCGRGAGGSKHGLLKICDFGAGKQYLYVVTPQRVFFPFFILNLLF